MAETKAEDEDDEGFGDFTFASFPDRTLNSFQINGTNSTTTDDDEWGDFIDYPIRAELQNGLSHSQSHSKPAKVVDPFGFFSDHSQYVETRIESVPDGVELGKTQWVKPKGALPLSIFGDAAEEEDEESVGVDPSAGVVKESFAGNMKSESNVHLVIGISDIFANRQQIKPENGFNSNSGGLNLSLNDTNSDLSGLHSNSDFVTENELITSSNKLHSLSKFHSSKLNSSFNSVIGTNWDPSELHSNSTVVAENELIASSNELHSLSKGSNSNIGGLNVEFDRLNSSLNSFVKDEEFDGDEEGWELKDAQLEARDGSGNDKVQEFSEITMYPLGLHNGSHGPIDLFATPNGFCSGSHKMDFGFDLKPSTLAQNGFISDSYFQTEWKDGSADSDENFGEFEAAFSEAGSKQGNEIRSENHKGAVPLSIFGVEEPETDDSLDIQHEFVFKPATYTRNVQSPSSNLSINDLLLDLYSQSEPIPSVDSKQQPTENGSDSTDRVFNPNLVDDDDGSWEFKDALSQSRVKKLTSLPCLVDANQNFSTDRKLNDYVDFYCKLKDELCFVARCHLDSLKKAQSTAALSGEDAKVAALDEEIQAGEELLQENIISKKTHSDDHPPTDICFKEYLETLHDPKFQALESEYHLSRRLSSADSDLRSAIELIKHSMTMLKILTLVSTKEQFDYVSMWSKMISVCAKELNHGTWILKQSLEKNVQSQILSELRGKQFIVGLGEIYRVVVVLGTSVKFFKPWILSNSVDSTGIYTLLEECHTLWSTSGLENALSNISDPIGSMYKGNVKSLLESIKHIRDLEALTLANHIFTRQESLCRLSLLNPGVVPDMKLVVWNGEKYFLTLANLWANLISCDPPKLPCLHVG